MDSTTTSAIVDALTRAIVEHRLLPGAKLVEQTLANQFGVSRTLIRQAFFRLSQNHLVRMEPARGAFVAAPSVVEARQVFMVRRILEAGLISAFIANATEAHIAALQDHVALEKIAVSRGDVPARTLLLGDFHVCMAQLLGNDVLALILMDLISRCALITLLYQSGSSAEHSHDEHEGIVKAIAQRNVELAQQLLESHLQHIEAALTLPALAPLTPQPSRH